MSQGYVEENTIALMQKISQLLGRQIATLKSNKLSSLSSQKLVEYLDRDQLIRVLVEQLSNPASFEPLPLRTRRRSKTVKTQGRPE